MKSTEEKKLPEIGTQTRSKGVEHNKVKESQPALTPISKMNS